MPSLDRGSPRRARAQVRVLNSIAIAAVVGVAGATGVVAATNQKAESVEKVDVLADVVVEKVSGWENYLLVGSDTREGADPSDPDFGGIGSVEETGGKRSDTIMVMHVDHDAGRASLVSLPRDLWLPIAGTGDEDRINSAFSRGEDVLVDTVQESLGVPINHYIEVDFQGFKRLVDAIGGVNTCFDYPVRDKNTGLDIGGSGCFDLDGVQALAYARSRHYQQFIDGEWVEDGTADLGRTARQQQLIAEAVKALLDKVAANPLAMDGVINAAVESVQVDPGTNILKAAKQLRPLADGGFDRYTLPVAQDWVGDAAVLELGDGSQEILDYFAGRGPKPEPEPTAETESTADAESEPES